MSKKLSAFRQNRGSTIPVLAGIGSLVSVYVDIEIGIVEHLATSGSIPTQAA